MKRQELLDILDNYLQPWKVRDFCPNGLQIEGKEEIHRVISGVTASQRLIDAAIAENADAILVHHGYFWKNEKPNLVGMKKQRIKALLDNDINLFAYHLPLDVHPEIGNNAQLGKLLGIDIQGTIEPNDPNCVVMHGTLSSPMSALSIAEMVESKLERKPLLCQVNNQAVTSVAWCTGGGQGYIDQAAAKNIDMFISGEVSEQTIHSAREQGIHFIAAGHHATERYGAKALGEYLADKFGLSVLFIDIDNPA